MQQSQVGMEIIHHRRKAFWGRPALLAFRFAFNGSLAFVYIMLGSTIWAWLAHSLWCLSIRVLFGCTSNSFYLLSGCTVPNFDQVHCLDALLTNDVSFLPYMIKSFSIATCLQEECFAFRQLKTQFCVLIMNRFTVCVDLHKPGEVCAIRLLVLYRPYIQLSYEILL